MTDETEEIEEPLPALDTLTGDESIAADLAEAAEWADAGLNPDVSAIEQMGFASMAQAYALIAIAKGIARHNEIQEELLT